MTGYWPHFFASLWTLTLSWFINMQKRAWPTSWQPSRPHNWSISKMYTTREDCIYYFTPCPKKYSGQHNQCTICTAHDGKVGCNTIKYTTVYMKTDWLHFLWHGILLTGFSCVYTLKYNIRESKISKVHLLSNIFARSYIKCIAMASTTSK